MDRRPGRGDRADEVGGAEVTGGQELTRPRAALRRIPKGPRYPNPPTLAHDRRDGDSGSESPPRGVGCPRAETTPLVTIPSDTGDLASILHTDHGADFGVDWITLTAPMQDFVPGEGWLSTSTERGLEQETFRSERTVQMKSGLVVHLCCITNEHGTYGTVAFNPSRIFTQPRWTLCPADQLRRVSLDTWSRLRQHHHFGLPADLDKAKVKRLDVACNLYGVDNPARTIGSLRPLSRAHATKNILYSDPGTGLPASFYVGGQTNGHVLVYDKTHEVELHRGDVGRPLRTSAVLAPPGTVRVEVKALEWCRRYGDIDGFADLVPANIEKLFWNRAAWSRVEAWVTDDPQDIYEFLETFRQSNGRPLSQADQLKIGKHINRLARGDASQLSAKLGRIAREVPAATSSPDFARGTGMKRRLDLRGHREAAEVVSIRERAGGGRPRSPDGGERLADAGA